MESITTTIRINAGATNCKSEYSAGTIASASRNDKMRKLSGIIECPTMPTVGYAHSPAADEEIILKKLKAIDFLAYVCYNGRIGFSYEPV